MKASLGAAIVAGILLLGLGSVSAEEAEEKDRSLVLKLADTYNLLPTGARVAASHTAEVFDSIGVAVRWEEPSTMAIPEAGQAELLVFIRPNHPEEIGFAENALGVVLSRATPQRAIYVFLPAIARAVGVTLGGLLRPDDERRLALALGKVIAHEAFHAVAPRLDHAERGITAAHLHRDVLVKSRAVIDRRAASVFRRELASLWKEAEGQVAAARPAAGTMNARGQRVEGGFPNR